MNRIVPLGDTYLELVSVIDEADARESVFGRWVASGASERGHPIGWAVRTDEIDAIARRLGLTVRAGSRAMPDGELLQWRSTGMEEAAAGPSLPFVEWSPGTELPSRIAVKHPTGTAAITRVLINGDTSRLAAWLGGQILPVVVRPGKLRIAGAVLSRAGSEILVDSVQS